MRTFTKVVVPALGVSAILASVSITVATAQPPPPRPPDIPAPAPPDAPVAPASGNVVFEVTGSGTVYSIDLDPGGRVGEDTAAPFRRSVAIGPDVSLLQVVVVTKTGSQGCRITVDGTVLAEQPIGDAAHCIATL